MSCSEKKMDASLQAYIDEMRELYPTMVKVRQRFMTLESLIRMKMITNHLVGLESNGIKITLIPAKPKTTIDLGLLEENEPDTYADLLADYPKDDHEISKLKIEVKKK